MRRSKGGSLIDTREQARFKKKLESLFKTQARVLRDQYDRAGVTGLDRVLPVSPKYAAEADRVGLKKIFDLVIV